MPLAPVAVAFGAGIALAPWTRAPVAWAGWLLAVGVVASLLAFGRPAWAAVALLVGVVALGALHAAPAALPPDHVANLPLPRLARLRMRLAEEPLRWAADRVRLVGEVISVDGAPRSGRVQLTLYGTPPAVTEGQGVEADVRLYRATGFRNPGGFDYAAYLAREGVHVVGSARGEDVVLLDDPSPPWPVTVKRRAVAAIEQALPPASAGLLSGLLLGDRAKLPPAMHEAFRRAGVYHVLAVSGFNVALLASAVWALLMLARVRRRVAAAVAIAVVVGFALVVGPQPSVLRATIMAVLVLAALILERDASVTNGLALAALVILAARPGDLLDPGFQLSFAATGGIIVAPMPRGVIAGGLAVSVAAQLAVLPISLGHFNQISTVGVVANLAVVPLAGLATVVGLLGVTLAFVHEATAAVVFDGVWPVLLALRAVVRLAASVPGAIVHLPAPPWTAVVSYTMALGLALAWWHLRPTRRRRARLAGAAALALLGAAATLTTWPIVRLPDGRLRLSVLDVGQGDAIVVETPDGRALLVDAGPGGPMRLDTGERVVAPFLWNRGVLTLAAVVATHDDADHVGGMAAVRRLFSVGESLDRRTIGIAPRWFGGAMLSPLAGGRGDTLELPSFEAPGPVVPRTARERNDDALVLRIDFGLASFLLVSDIGAAAERGLLAARAPLLATVLKVAHHGSRTSSTPEFLRAVRPAIAVVSVGARNPYGHPDAATLERLTSAGARTFRTDRDGAVLFETDGRELTVTRWAERRRERYCLDPDTPC